MKILAQNSNTYIVEAHEDELARIQGFHSASACGGTARPRLGMEIDVNTMFTACCDAVSIQRELEQAVATHKKLIASLERLNTILAPHIEKIKAAKPK